MADEQYDSSYAGGGGEGSAEYYATNAEEVPGSPAAAPTVRRGWAPMEQRRMRFHERQLNEVLPALQRGHQMMAAELKRKHEGRGDRRERAEGQRQHWVRQRHANEMAQHMARKAFLSGDDAACTGALLTSRQNFARSARPVSLPVPPARGDRLAEGSVAGGGSRSARAPSPRTTMRVLHTPTPPLVQQGHVPIETSDGEYESTARQMAAAPAPATLPATITDWSLQEKGTPRSVAAEYARDRERRKGETFVLPALTVPKVRLTAHRRR